MSDPLYKSQRNNKTGAVRQLVSDDDGITWKVSSERPAPGGDPMAARQVEADAMAAAEAGYGADVPPFDPNEPHSPAAERPIGGPLAGYREPADATTFRRTRGGPEYRLDEGDVSSMAEAVKPRMSEGEAATRGAGDAASFGHGDNAQGFGAMMRASDERTLSPLEALARRVGLIDGPAPVAYDRDSTRGIQTGEGRVGADGVDKDADVLSSLAARARGIGGSYMDARNEYRAEDAAAREDRPADFLQGQVVGALATAAAPMGPAAAPGLARAARMSRAATGGAVAGGLTGHGASEAEDAGGQLADTARGAAIGAVAAPVFAEGASMAIRPALSALAARAPAAGKAADKLRVRSYGGMKGDLDRLAGRPGGIARYARGGERLGIGQGGVLPTKVSDIATEAEAAQMAAQARKNAIADELANSSATVNPRQLERNIKGMKAEHAAGGAAGQPLRDELDKIAAEEARMDLSYTTRVPVEDEFVPVDPYTIQTQIDPAAKLKRGARGKFEAVPGTPLDIEVGHVPEKLRVDVERHPSFAKMDKERRDWGKATNFDAGSPRQALRQGVYGQINETMADAANQARPGAGQEWRAANEDEHIALTLKELAESRDNADAVNRKASASDYGLGTTGGLGALIAGADPATAATVALGAGLGNRFVRGREHALGAGAMRRIEGGLEAAGRYAQEPQFVSSPLSALAARTTPHAAPSFGLGMQPAMAQDAAPSAQQVAESTRGHESEAKVRAALQQSPQQLGKYAQPLQQAADSEDPDALEAEISRLSQTDERFRTRVLPQLQGAP